MKAQSGVFNSRRYKSVVAWVRDDERYRRFRYFDMWWFANLARVLLGMVVASLCLMDESTAAEPLRVGVARVDLTPPLSMQAALGGYGARMSRPATEVHDRVWVKAIVFSDGQHRHAVVTADILALPPGFRQEVAEKLGADQWSADDLLFLPSHSHTSVDLMALNRRNLFGIPQLGVFHQEVLDWTVARFAECITAAARELVEIKSGSSTTTMENWNRNRRGSGVTDPEVTLTRIDTVAGQPLAVLVNWPAHPTFMDAEDMSFSGDWPGHLQRTLEALIGNGVTVFYYNGAEGDQSPTPRLNNAPRWEQAERYGRELAIEVWQQWKELSQLTPPTVDWHVEDVPLPPLAAHPELLEAGGKEYGLTAELAGPLLKQLCPDRTHCTTLRFGDLIVVGVPGELTAELGREIKAAVRTQRGVQHVAVGGLADEWISYVLSQDDYHRGGYEASMSFYGDTLGSTIVAGAIRSVAAKPK
jgi:hypothetical protein